MAHFLLDVNETLSDMTPVGATMRRHGANEEMARSWFAAVLRDGFALSLHGRAPAFLDLARQQLHTCLGRVEDLDAPVEEVADDVLAVLGGLEVHPDVVPGIVALTGAGHLVSALSNGSREATRGLLGRAGILDRFAHVLSVEDRAVWKPHPEAYAAAVAQVGVLPADLTMVAVHPWDLDGAARAGLRTVWVDRTGTPWPGAFRTPGHRARGITGLVEVPGPPMAPRRSRRRASR